MLLHQIYRWRIAVGLFVLVVFGVAEYAESGLFRRCRRRVRCRPVVCQPVCCEPVCCEPAAEPAVSKSAMMGACDGKMCPIEIVAKIVNPFDPDDCWVATYDCDDCDSPDDVRWTSNCNHAVPTNCLDCNGCVVKPPIIIIPPPPPPIWYIPEESQASLPGPADLVPGPNYRKEGGAGKTYQLQLLDAQQRPINGAQMLVELNWLLPTEEASSDLPCGIGIPVKEGQPQALKATAKRLSEFIYYVTVTQEQGKGEPRHYTVFLSKPPQVAD